MGHFFVYEKIWEILRVNPKWIKTPTLSDVKSNRTRNSILFDVSDEGTNNDLNADTYDIPNIIEEISPHVNLSGATKRNTLNDMRTKL